MNIVEFCRNRIQSLTDEFRTSGTCSGEIFECCYLTYLEVHEVSRGRPPQDVWDGWIEVLVTETGKKEPLNRSFNLHEQEGREKLIEQLEQYRLKLATPIARKTSVAPAEKETETTEEIDAFELFFGE